jgi:PIN domain nuclease of toxin-antitoxin system
MRLLFDTHTFLWFVLNDAKLSGRAQEMVAEPANDILVSPASYWEIAIKVSLKKLDLLAPYEDFMARGIKGNEFEVLLIEPRRTAVLVDLPYHHRDPFDRLMIAQAMVEQVPIVSRDPIFDPYPVTRVR